MPKMLKLFNGVGVNLQVRKMGVVNRLLKIYVVFFLIQQQLFG